eukprot:m.151033 g.151033  ORF g.151033 m.151033 type:complete len:201 (-) comp14280_c0_seq4:3511-4113(-)
MSAPGGSSVVLAGFMTKRGKVVKSWKRRFMVLLSNGKLLYFTKPRAGWDSTPPSEWEPVDWDNSEPKGTLNVVSDVLELVHWDQTKEDGLVVWEKKTPPYTGFCLKAKRGRIWSIYAESTEVDPFKLGCSALHHAFWGHCCVDLTDMVHRDVTYGLQQFLNFELDRFGISTGISNGVCQCRGQLSSAKTGAHPEFTSLAF